MYFKLFQSSLVSMKQSCVKRFIDPIITKKQFMLILHELTHVCSLNWIRNSASILSLLSLYALHKELFISQVSFFSLLEHLKLPLRLMAMF